MPLLGRIEKGPKGGQINVLGLPGGYIGRPEAFAILKAKEDRSGPRIVQDRMARGQTRKPQSPIAVNKKWLSTPMRHNSGARTCHERCQRVFVAPQFGTAIQRRSAKCNSFRYFHICSRATFRTRSQKRIALNQCLEWFNHEVNLLGNKATG